MVKTLLTMWRDFLSQKSETVPLRQIPAFGFHTAILRPTTSRPACGMTGGELKLQTMGRPQAWPGSIEPGWSRKEPIMRLYHRLRGMDLQGWGSFNRTNNFLPASSCIHLLLLHALDIAVKGGKSHRL